MFKPNVELSDPGDETELEGKIQTCRTAKKQQQCIGISTGITELAPHTPM